MRYFSLLVDFGWLVGWSGRSKIGRSHFKLILCCFWSYISPLTKFHPNPSKNTEVENLRYWSVWLVGLVGQKMVVGISNSFYVVFGPLLAPMPNFIQIGQKTQKLKIFAIGRFWWVGLVGQKMVIGISNSFYVVFSPILAPKPNFIQIGQKTQKLKIFTILVSFGWSGWKVEK